MADSKTLMGLAAGAVLGAAAMNFFTSQKAPTGSSEEVPTKGRKYLVGGNWKCNGTKESVEKLVETLNKCGPIPSNVEVVVAPPTIHIPMVQATLRSDIAIAAQDCGLNADFGAFTGELCAKQLKDLGITWAIIGHSERREGFPKGAGNGESNELVVDKTKVAVDAGLNVMLCIGETQQEKEEKRTMKVIAAQLEPCKAKLKTADWDQIAIAYEPVWAIGTGLTATPEEAQATQKEVREWVKNNVGPDVAAKVRIQYGGSMKGENAKDLLSQADIDGGLIGGAALKADFFNIINAANAK